MTANDEKTSRLDLRRYRLAVSEQRRQERLVNLRWMTFGFLNIVSMTGGLIVYDLLN